jgi:D-alanyl-D-alanine dipeptidase
MNFLKELHIRLCALLLVLLQLGFGQEVSVRITPLRPVEELRAEALKEQPPREPGTFLKSDLVELIKRDPTIKLDIRYATTNNFLGTPVYTQPRAFLQRPAAEALLRAHRELKVHGYGLIIHDGYRPWYVTKIFWDATPDDKKTFVADPAEGSKHNRGCAVDLSLIRFEDGQGSEDAQWLRRNDR